MRWVALLLLPLTIASTTLAGLTDTKALGVSSRPQLLMEVPAAPFPAHIPGEGVPAWSRDSRHLAFSTPDGLSVLQLNGVVALRKVNDRPSFDPAWSPDGSRIAYVGERPNRQRSVYLQAIPDGASVDLLPSDLSLYGIKEISNIDMWLDVNTLAFEAFVGSGLKALFLMDVSSGEFLPTPQLITTVQGFVWSKDGKLVAGQTPTVRRSFWIWNRERNTVMEPTIALPGKHQVVEAFFDGGQKVLFSSWDGTFPYTGQAPVGLYEMDLNSGQVTEISRGAALAASSDGLVAYVRFGQRPELVVQDLVKGRIRWTEDLGKVTAKFTGSPTLYRPQFFGRFVVYRTLTEEWQISEGTRKDTHTIYRGREATVSVSPNGRYTTVLDNLPEPHLLLYRNTLLAR